MKGMCTLAMVKSLPGGQLSDVCVLKESRC